MFRCLQDPSRLLQGQDTAGDTDSGSAARAPPHATEVPLPAVAPAPADSEVPTVAPAPVFASAAPRSARASPLPQAPQRNSAESNAGSTPDSPARRARDSQKQGGSQPAAALLNTGVLAQAAQRAVRRPTGLAVPDLQSPRAPAPSPASPMHRKSAAAALMHGAALPALDEPSPLQVRRTAPAAARASVAQPQAQAQPSATTSTEQDDDDAVDEGAVHSGAPQARAHASHQMGVAPAAPVHHAPPPPPNLSPVRFATAPPPVDVAPTEAANGVGAEPSGAPPSAQAVLAHVEGDAVSTATPPLAFASPPAQKAIDRGECDTPALYV